MQHATMEDLEELHGLLIGTLIERLSGAPSVPEMEIAGRLLHDHGITAESPEDMALLREMFNLLKQRLHEALSQPSPKAAVLAESRRFLKNNGINYQGSPALNAADAFASLAGVDFPFKT